MKTFLSTTGSGIGRAVQENGDHWTVDTQLEGKEITCIAGDPRRPGVIYAGTRDEGVLCSIDGGLSWSAAGLSGRTVKAVAASRAAPGLLYAGTKPACLFVSPDYGRHWEELSAFRKIFSRRFWFSPAEAPFTAYVQGITISPSAPDTIVVGIEFGAVVRSTDGGRTWEDHRRGALRDCHTITFHITDGDWVYEAGGTGAGAAFSRDGGKTWTQPKSGLDRHYGWACASDPARPEIWYASLSPAPSKAHSEGNAQAHIFRCNGNGEWKKLGGGLPQPLDHMPYALVTDPQEPGHVYAGMSSGDVWRSRDWGETWEQMPFHLKCVRRSMILVDRL